MINIRRQCDCTQQAIDLVATEKVKIDFMITHRFTLDKTQDALEMVSGYGDGVIKAMIEF